MAALFLITYSVKNNLYRVKEVMISNSQEAEGKEIMVIHIIFKFCTRIAHTF